MCFAFLQSISKSTSCQVFLCCNKQSGQVFSISLSPSVPLSLPSRLLISLFLSSLSLSLSLSVFLSISLHLRKTHNLSPSQAQTHTHTPMPFMRKIVCLRFLPKDLFALKPTRNTNRAILINAVDFLVHHHC